MARQKRPAAAQILQHQWPALQIHAAEGQAANHVGGRAAPSSCNRRYARQTANRG